MRIGAVIVAFGSIALFFGCSTYIPPSGRADLSTISSFTIRRASREACGCFPQVIAAVRVQAPNYRSYFTERKAEFMAMGRYSVITVKEVEDESDLDRISKMPNVGGLVSISRLLLPQTLKSDRELREAAARLKADMLLLYTFDTSFHDNDESVALNVITLGLSPNASSICARRCFGFAHRHSDWFHLCGA